MCLVVAFMDNTDLAQTYEEFDFRHNLECIIGILNVDNSGHAVVQRIAIQLCFNRSTSQLNTDVVGILGTKP